VHIALQKQTKAAAAPQVVLQHHLEAEKSNARKKS